MENLIALYENLPSLIQYLFNFLFTVVFLRGIVANTLLNEMRQRWQNNDGRHRYERIWKHYKERHLQEDLLSCRVGSCAKV